MLNDGYDEEALPEDQLSSPNPYLSMLSTFSQSELTTFHDIPDVEINPSESASQSISYPSTTTAADSSIISYASQNPLPTTNLPTTKKEAWFWAYFTKHEVHQEWYTRKHKKRKLMDINIQCSIMDQNTGKQCCWVTTDSKRQGSTSNLTLHLLRKHSIYPPGVSSPGPVKNTRELCLAFEGKETKILLANNSWKMTSSTGLLLINNLLQQSNRQHGRSSLTSQGSRFYLHPDIPFGSGLWMTLSYNVLN